MVWIREIASQAFLKVRSSTAFTGRVAFFAFVVRFSLINELVGHVVRFRTLRYTLSLEKLKIATALKALLL